MVEEEFKGYHIDLVKERRRSRLYVWGMVAVAIFAIGSTIMIPGMVKKNLENSVFLSQNGEVVSIGLENRRDNLDIEILSNAEYWLDTYYTYNQANVDQQRELGLYLCSDETLKYLEGKWRAWVVDVKNQGLIQDTELLGESVAVRNLTDSGFDLEFTGEMSVRNEDYLNVYSLRVETHVLFVDRAFPKNRYGMQFIRYSDAIEQTIVNEEIR